MESSQRTQRLTLGWRDTFRLLAPYARRHFFEQVSSIWFIVAYLIIFQLLILQLPIVFAGMIAVGILIVAFGLMFFMEGLRLGLMPLGESIGAILPRSGNILLILTFSFLLGIGATFAEPAIAVLKAAGSGVAAKEAPLLYSLLNDFSSQLVASVGVGVGFAVLLGVLRFFYGWSLKTIVIPVVSFLLIISLMFNGNDILKDVLDLAWDCGAVTTGPVTVPLVLALGIGVCRVVGTGSSRSAGFGIVTLASLFPIMSVLLLASYHFVAQDFYGAENYVQSASLVIQDSHRREASAANLGAQAPSSSVDPGMSLTPEQGRQEGRINVTIRELDNYIRAGILPDGYQAKFRGGKAQIQDGSLVIVSPEVVIYKEYQRPYQFVSEKTWDDSRPIASASYAALLDAIRAIIPLCLFLYIVQRFALKQVMHRREELRVGIIFAVLGMTLFGLGIALGLTPLGSQLGSNVPATFASITPWGLDFVDGPIFESEHSGKVVAILFAFFLGYGATLAEPALNALGDTVEKITVGAFNKKLLMQCVAVGVGFGIAAGICKIAYDLPLIWMLIPPYTVVLVLTWYSPEQFVNFGWDSAGVTTGPITVPLVLAMGLGVGGNIPGVSDGFGILALASVYPILSVLSVGLLTRSADEQELQDTLIETGVDLNQAAAAMMSTPASNTGIGERL